MQRFTRVRLHNEFQFYNGRGLYQSAEKEVDLAEVEGSVKFLIGNA